VGGALKRCHQGEFGECLDGTSCLRSAMPDWPEMHDNCMQASCGLFCFWQDPEVVTGGLVRYRFIDKGHTQIIDDTV
jgi:hypothetical protein